MFVDLSKHSLLLFMLQSLYKSDLEWLKGIGWVPLGSLNVEHVKRAGEILSENKYRQPPNQMKFTCITDAWDVELAKHNAEIMSKVGFLNKVTNLP